MNDSPDERLGLDRRSGSRPVPDPTALTDAAIAKLKGQVEDTLAERGTRFDRDIKHVDEFSALRTAYERQISDIRQLAAEKLSARESELNSLALTAALAAAKESAGTQASTFADSLAALGRIVETSLKALGDKVEDVKDRVGRIESVATGAIAQRTETRQGNSAGYALVASMVGVGVFALTVIGFILARMP